MDASIVQLVTPTVTAYQRQVANLAASIVALSQAVVGQREEQFIHHWQMLRNVGQGNIERQGSRLERVVNGLGNLVLIVHQRSLQHLQRVGERVISAGKHQVELAYRQLLVKMELRSASMRLVQQCVLQVQHYETLFRGLSPEVQLRRGFALIQRMDNEYITSGNSVKPGDTVRIEFHDTKRQAVIKE